SPLITNCIISYCESGYNGGGIALESSDATIVDCIFFRNSAVRDGGGLHLRNGDSVIFNCVFNENTADDDAGGLYIYTSSYYSPVIYNCLIHRNTCGSHGGGIMVYSVASRITNCTIAGNHAGSGGGISLRSSHTTTIWNSIIWANSPSSLFHEYAASPDIKYCNIFSGYPGLGNISSDPLFYSGEHGEYYLSNIECGQNQFSPCINTGSGPASDECIDLSWETVCMDGLTTRTDHVCDQLTVDMGYHYPPASLPTPTPTPACQSTGVILDMPSHFFHPGDICWLHATACNSSGMNLDNYALFVALDVGGEFWFAPAWKSPDEGLSYYRITLLPGETRITVLEEFVWPDLSVNMDNLKFWAVLMNPDMTLVMSDIDVWEFGW
ncbi:right-handed parallel beta-helix repeat-containing protein, partial [bacterium]|nr:right-handed parallel beta-helix repeat-containing protein [bacterium]